jgi:hypothetical protein
MLRLNARCDRGKLACSRYKHREPPGLPRRDSPGSWRNWQTRKVEGLVPARACWFNSSRAHFLIES